ncbi:tRNA threonylcarbamoyladenosine dehydratase [Sulfuriroseicoccus oceanibius]|uniref:tRNA threonylcarbamoyladenosine dehydratase n=1 Tax=Sulfuriroseicoccus oceanibius TaxID=2707525 RepID=A0A6B3L126_9BACT|nr:tRNA threonylcarbamoyladenosine dehydratase [Sulfuriroseicoccus oceanibius]QQL43693.1 tRNA threonylcarbamoyladenosine dehydratase [Sulfuriroseicoccus oceanibius]
MSSESSESGELNRQDPAVRYGGTARLYGRAGFERVRAARVCVIGVGGVGSWVAESLLRSGVGTIGLVDLDDVCMTNTNRQVHALERTVGQPKVEAMRDRLLAIDSAARVETYGRFFTAASSDELLGHDWDFVVDAIDSVRAKCQLIADCVGRRIPMVVCGGAGGKSDPTALRTGDVATATHDPLLKKVRRVLRTEHGFSKAEREAFGVPAVYSVQNPVFPWADGSVCETPEPNQSLRLDCASGFGTACHVTGAFGFAAAAVAMRTLAESAR